jgi:hypothetical protein
MKITERTDFRVEVTFHARTLSDLGLTNVQGQIVNGDLSVKIAPQRLGDFGGASISDARVSSDIAGDYERRCTDLLAEIRRQRPTADGQVVWTETETCSHCHLSWEVLTAEDITCFPNCTQDEHSVAGEPLCCEKAIVEFRAERGIPALAEAGESR